MYQEAPKIRVDEPFTVNALICWLLAKFGKLSEDQFFEITSYDDMVNSLDLIQGLSNVEEKRLVTVVTGNNDSKLYALTDKATALIEQFEAAIPRSIREKAIAEGERVVERDNLSKSLSWGIFEENGVWYFTAKLLNELGGPFIFEVKAYAGTRENAQALQKRFLANPNEILTETLRAFTS